MNTETLKASLPQDLFNPDRLPARDENGMVWHPDYDLIYSGLGVDDEGHAAWEFMKGMGFEFSFDEMDGNLYDQHEQEVESGSLSFWNPETPEGWLLLGIYAGEDGPVVWFVRKEQA